MRDLIGTKLELRLGDPIDSEIDRKVAALVPVSGLTFPSFLRLSAGPAVITPACRPESLFR